MSRAFTGAAAPYCNSPAFSAVNVPCARTNSGIYFSNALYPAAPRFSAQSASRLLQFSINDSLMARSARTMRPKQLDTLLTARDQKTMGTSLARINPINNITHTSKDRADSADIPPLTGGR
jgi:hypothetical protein